MFLAFWGSEILRIALNTQHLLSQDLHKLLEKCKGDEFSAFGGAASVVNDKGHATQFVSKNQMASFGAKVKIEDHLARGQRKNGFIEKYGQLALL